MIPEQRAAVVAEAESWLKTPFVHEGDVKGSGVDCAMLLVRVYQAVGLLPPDFDPRPYPAQWFMHQGEERYLDIVRRLGGIEVAEPGPGDVVLYHFGRCYSHGGIVKEWPRIIHAWSRPGVRGCHYGEGDQVLGNRPRLYFTVPGAAEAAP